MTKLFIPKIRAKAKVRLSGTKCKAANPQSPESPQQR